MDWLFKILIGVGAAIVADTVVKETTGKHIHEHVYAWWRRICDKISEFLNEHPEIPARNGFLQVLTKAGSLVDMAKVRMDRLLRVQAGVLTDEDEFYLATEEEISKEELIKQFPELANSAQILLPMSYSMSSGGQEYSGYASQEETFTTEYTSPDWQGRGCPYCCHVPVNIRNVRNYHVCRDCGRSF